MEYKIGLCFMMLLKQGSVATCPVVLHWLCDSPRTRCAWRTKYVCMERASNNKRDCGAWSLLLLVATVQSFAHMSLRISDRIGSFFALVHTILWDASFCYSKKIIIWHKLLLLLDKVLSEFLEQILTHSLFN